MSCIWGFHIFNSFCFRFGFAVRKQIVTDTDISARPIHLSIFGHFQIILISLQIIMNTLAKRCVSFKMYWEFCQRILHNFCSPHIYIYIYIYIVRVLLCVSCVPSSCVHIWFVSCPHQMSLWVNSCPAVFVWLSMIYLCIYSPVCSVWFRLVYSLLPVFPVCEPCLVLPCLALMSLLNTIIWVYVLVCVSLFLPAVCSVTYIYIYIYI